MQIAIKCICGSESIVTDKQRVTCGCGCELHFEQGGDDMITPWVTIPDNHPMEDPGNRAIQIPEATFLDW
jgi:hypothetical protein